MTHPVEPTTGRHLGGSDPGQQGEHDGGEQAEPAEEPAAGRRPRRRRARGLAGTVGITVLGAVLPGAGFVWSGRRSLGLVVILAALAGAGYLAWSVGGDLDAVVALAFDPQWLRAAAVSLTAGLLLWASIVVTTYLMVRPRNRSRWQTFAGSTFVLVLCVTVAAPVALGARYATVQADLVTTVFEDNASATRPKDVSVVDPWGDRDQVSVLLLGGDGGIAREGVRTDTVVLLTMDTSTGRTVMFSLPRNMMRAQFPPGSPLHTLYPEGYFGYDDPAFYMLNALYGQIPERHPGILGKSGNEGADVVKQAVAGSLGLDVDYYVLVSFEGFKKLVDAIGGITVNVNEPVAIEGNTDLGIPPVGYIDPGPDRHLDGYHALWFARGRYGSDDYERMERQRCVIDALIDAADPLTVLRRYEALVEAGKEVVETDVPSDLLPAFVELAGKMKDAQVRSVVFRNSERFFSGDPDFAWMRSVVDRALDPPRPRRSAEGSPSPSPQGQNEGENDPRAREDAAEDPESSCAYTGGANADDAGGTGGKTDVTPGTAPAPR